jgi:hypothetical protein
MPNARLPRIWHRFPVIPRSSSIHQPLAEHIDLCGHGFRAPKPEMTTVARTILVALLTAPIGPASVAQGPAPIDGWDPGSAFVVDATIPEAPNTGCRFGFAVAMTDDIAVIGAPDVRLVDRRFPALNLGSNGAGAAFVFERTEGTNEWTFVQRLIAPTRVLAQTGSAVAIDPVTKDIIVGAWAYDAVATFGGAAFVYRKGAGNSWGEPAIAAAFGPDSRIPSQTLAPDDLQAIDQFGFSVAIHDGVAAVGCPLAGDNNSGAVYIFERDAEGAYQQLQKFSDPDAGANDQLGTKLAVHGNLIAAGIQNDDVEGRVNAGSVAVLVRSGDTWSQAIRLAAPAPATSAALGSSVAVVDGVTTDWVVAGAPLQASGPGNVSGNGTALVFKSPNNAFFTLDATLLPRTANLNNNFGFAVAASLQDPPLLMVGSPGFDTAIASVDEPGTLVQVANAGAGFAFRRVGAEWQIRGESATRGDAWSPSIVANSNTGRSVALPAGGGAFALVGADTPTGSLGTVVPFRFTNAIVGTGDGQVSGPASGVLGEDGRPGEDGSAGNGAGGTGGGIGGGGSPGTGITAGPGAITIPLTPIVYDWGVIKGTAVALEGRRVHLLQTDGKHRAQRPRFGYLGELPAGATYVGLGDMNGDFSGDIVFVDRGGVLRYWKRDAFRIVDTLAVDTLPAGFDAIAVADIDADRKPDILLQGVVDPTQLRVWHIDNGAISGSDEYELPAGDWNLVTGSFRTRTSTDLLARNPANGAVFLVGLGNGTDATLTPIASRPNSVRLAGFGDVDGNGQPDIFWQGGKTEIDLMDQDDDGNYVSIARRRVGFADADIVNIRDWNDDGKVDFWMRRGSRNYVQYGTFVNGYVYGNSSRDLGKVPGTVVGVADR